MTYSLSMVRGICYYRREVLTVIEEQVRSIRARWSRRESLSWHTTPHTMQRLQSVSSTFRRSRRTKSSFAFPANTTTRTALKLLRCTRESLASLAPLPADTQTLCRALTERQSPTIMLGNRPSTHQSNNFVTYRQLSLPSRIDNFLSHHARTDSRCISECTTVHSAPGARYPPDPHHGPDEARRAEHPT